MRTGTQTLLARAWIVLAATLALPSPALAGWGDDNWGALVWSAVASGPAVPVPGLGLLGAMVLATGLAVTTAWTLRKRRPALGLTLMLVLLASPLVVVAGELTLPNTFADRDFKESTTSDNTHSVKLATIGGLLPHAGWLQAERVLPRLRGCLRGAAIPSALADLGFSRHISVPDGLRGAGRSRIEPE